MVRKKYQISDNDIKEFESESAENLRLVAIAKQFLKSTTSQRGLDKLSPEELAAIGKLLQNPEQLLKNKNILKWQNIRRNKGKLVF